MSFIQFEHEGQRMRLAVVRTARGVWVGWPGGARFFAPQQAESAPGVAAAEVRAPMTARVVQVAAVAGKAVAAGDLLVILQAMKMEYRLTAPGDGMVERVHCAEGDMVDLGTTLVTLVAAAEPAGPRPLDQSGSKAPAPRRRARRSGT